MPYQTVEEAIERVNATTFGLGSSVWTNDRIRAHAVADQLESGTTRSDQYARSPRARAAVYGEKVEWPRRR